MGTKNKDTDKKFLLTGYIYAKTEDKKSHYLCQTIDQEIFAPNNKEAIKKSKEIVGEIVKNYPIKLHKIEAFLYKAEKIWKRLIEIADLPTTPS